MCPLSVEGVLLRSTCTRVKHGARAAQFKVGLEEEESKAGIIVTKSSGKAYEGLSLSHYY